LEDSNSLPLNSLSIPIYRQKGTSSNSKQPDQPLRQAAANPLLTKCSGQIFTPVRLPFVYIHS